MLEGGPSTDQGTGTAAAFSECVHAHVCAGELLTPALDGHNFPRSVTSEQRNGVGRAAGDCGSGLCRAWTGGRVKDGPVGRLVSDCHPRGNQVAFVIGVGFFV